MLPVIRILRALAERRFQPMDSVMAPEVFLESLRRESARADRGGSCFSLVLVRLPNARVNSLSARRILRTLCARARVTDQVGRYSDRQLGVILPGTDVAGAQRFVEDVGRLLGRRGPRPLCMVYGYPGDGDGREDWRAMGMPEVGVLTSRRWHQGREDDNRHDHFDGRGGGGGGGAGWGEARGDGRGTGHGEGNGQENGRIHGGPQREEGTAGEANGQGHGNGLHPGAQPEHLATGGGIELAQRPAGWALRPDLMPYVISGALAEREDLSLRPVVALPMETLLIRPMPLWKRVVDLVGASVGLVVCAPVLVGVGLAVKISSRGPLIFTQQRAGLGGRPFTMYKFRTMVADAEKQLERLRRLNEQDGAAFKMRNDPRVTRVGRFLRKMSLDELPQLWNVLKGDMTLVGPRPLPSQQSQLCAQWQRRRLDVTPGLTCIWQVKGRSQVKFDDWVRMDMCYIRQRTFWQDMKILLQTTPAVLKGRGAY
jgi:lipopolysaccharide/colanic/teichoic acid biosynthesis glycosyltransferase